MNQTPYIGKRIELISMDPHFQDISIGLYEDDQQSKPFYRIHTYSQKDGAAERIAFLTDTMKTLGGLVCVDSDQLSFCCGTIHEQALKRIFLDSCKINPASGAIAYPMHILDKKSGCEIKISHIGDGVYQLTSEDDEQKSGRRITAIARGLLKLGQMQEVEDCNHKVAFACGQPHDELIALLLVRAPNVRTAMREAESMASRGVLAAPSGQE